MWLLSSTTGWKDILNKTQEMLRLNFRLIFWYITRINMHCTLPDIFVLQLHRDTLNPLLQQICQIHPYTTLYHHEPITENLYYVNHSCNFQRVNAYYLSDLKSGTIVFQYCIFIDIIMIPFLLDVYHERMVLSLQCHMFSWLF